MLGETHAVIGAVATASILISVGYTPETDYSGNFMVAVMIGSLIALLPDIDQPQSRFRRILGLNTRQLRKNLRQWYKRPLAAFSALLHYPFALLFDLLAKLLPHRGPSHWLLVALLLTAGFNYLVTQQGWRPIFGYAFAIGYISHLIADSCTVRGIPLWGPFSKNSFRLLPRKLCIRTGSKGEAVMAALLLLPFMMLAVQQYFATFAP